MLDGVAVARKSKPDSGREQFTARPPLALGSPRIMPGDDSLPSSTDRNPAYDTAKARRAARHPRRPGSHCAAPAGAFRPEIDRRRCEGKADCVAVCPYGVFVVATITDGEYRALPFLSRFKLRVHGKQTAYTPDASACQACGLCVVACAEHAITLVASPA